MKFFYAILLGLFAFPGYSQRIINVVDWGADPTGKTDALPAIQKAIDASDSETRNIIYFPKGRYLIASFTKTTNHLENYCVKMHNNLEFKGDGNSSIISLSDHLFEGKDSVNNAHLFYGKEIQNVAFSSLCIDMNGSLNTPGEGVKKNHAAIFITHGRNVCLKKINVLNAAGTNMINIKGRGSVLKILQCSFSNDVKLQQSNCFQYDFSFVYSEWDSTHIKNSTIFLEKDPIGICKNTRPYNGGIEIHGSDSWVKNCNISNCFPGIYIASTGKPMKNVAVSENKLFGCTKGISFWVEYPMDSILINKNKIGIMSEKIEHFRFCTGIEMPNGNAEEYNRILANAAPISHLIIRNNVITSLASAENASGIILHSVHDSKIENNKISGVSKYGIALLGSKWGSSHTGISNNEIELKNVKPELSRKTNSYAVYLSDNIKKKSVRKCSFEKIKVNNNILGFAESSKKENKKKNYCTYQFEIPEDCKSIEKDCIEILKNKISSAMDEVCWKYLQ